MFLDLQPLPLAIFSGPVHEYDVWPAADPAPGSGKLVPGAGCTLSHLCL